MQEITTPQPPAEPEQTPGVPADAPPAVHAAARNGDVDGAGETDALDWLLGATKRPQYTLPFHYETPAGRTERLIFRFAGMDARRIEEIDAANRQGDGPFAKLDATAFNAQVAAESVIAILNPATGKEVTAEEFVGEAPAPAIGWEMRFKYQPGILDGLVGQIREKAGFNADRVGNAQRSLVEAAGNS